MPLHDSDKHPNLALLRLCCVVCCCAEGDISTRASHIEHLSQAASLPTVKTVCETGFNQGFSAITWLASNPSLHVYSFDIMRYSGSYAALEFVQNNFPGRLTLIRGDSKHSIANFASAHPEVTCDIIFVDALHTFDGALTDMTSFSQLAHAQTVLFMDDLLSDKFHGVEKAWLHAIDGGLIVESHRVLAIDVTSQDWPSCNRWQEQALELGVGRFTEEAISDGRRTRCAWRSALFVCGACHERRLPMNLRRPAPVSHTVSMTAIDGRFGTKTQSATSSSAHTEAVHVLQRRRLQSFGFASSPRIAHWNGIP